MDEDNHLIKNNLNISTFQEKYLKIERISYEHIDRGLVPVPAVCEAYLLAVALRPLHATNLTFDGEHSTAAGACWSKEMGNICLLRSDLEINLYTDRPFDIMRLYIEYDMLLENMDGKGFVRLQALKLSPFSMKDPIISNLLHCLAETPGGLRRGSPLFMSSIGLALASHLADAYGEKAISTLRIRGGLAPWQEKRAKEILSSNLHGEISIAELAHQCSLSPAYFATSFKNSTGKTPSRWLMELRIDQAKSLLKDNRNSLTEIALVCGFADQAHFTKNFSRITGIAPGAWRRISAAN